MGLSAEEQAELEMLQAPSPAGGGGGLTPAEEAELHALQKGPEEGLVSKAARILSIPTQVRDAVAFAHPRSNAENPGDITWDDPFAPGSMPPSAKPKTKPLVTPQDLKRALQGRGAFAGEYMARQGLDPEAASYPGFAADVAMPGDPTGWLLGQGVAKTSDGFRKLGQMRLLRAAALAKRDPKAVYATLKEMGVAGGWPNQARKIQAGIDALDGKVGALTKGAEDAGAEVNGAKFLDEAHSITEDARATDYLGDDAANQLQHGAIDPLGRATYDGPGGVALSPTDARKFMKSWGQAAGGNKRLQQLRAALRNRLVSDLPAEAGGGIDQALTKEGHLLTVRSAANRAAYSPSPWRLMRPVAGAAYGAYHGARNSDGFDLGKIGMNALGYGTAAAALSSPFALTRGAQAFEAASPWLGNAATQGAYRLLPEEENQ